MKVKKVKVIKCEECDAIRQIEPGMKLESVLDDAFECGECGEVYQEEDEAKDCCKE